MCITELSYHEYLICEARLKGEIRKLQSNMEREPKRIRKNERRVQEIARLSQQLQQLRISKSNIVSREDEANIEKGGSLTQKDPSLLPATVFTESIF